MDDFHRSRHLVTNFNVAERAHSSTPAYSSKRRRNPLACTECRQRKSRCDGQRPNCSSCLVLSLECEYQEASQQGSSKRRTHESKNLQLTQRIRVLEAKLRSISGGSLGENVPAVSATQNALLEPAARTTYSTSARAERSRLERISGVHVDQNIAEEVAVDVLATAAFNDEPQLNIGCFGPSSNHALFRALSGVFAHTARICFPMQQHSMARWARSHHTRAQTRSSTPLGHQTSKKPDNERGAVDPFALPREQDAISLINHFFATVGLVLPCVSKSTLVLEYNQARRQDFHRVRRDFLALLNIVWAHASSSLRNSEANTFYLRTLALLDEQTLRGTSQEMVQALFLLGSFQQNNQRSVASWTPHALAVKASLQLGLHSPESYKDHPFQESELRKRIWYGVINNDRFLSTSLGRPCLIPTQHVRVERPQDSYSISQMLPMVTPELTDSLIYFNYIMSGRYVIFHSFLKDADQCPRSLCSIASSTIELLYDHNIESSGPLNFPELVSNKLQLSWRLEKWRESLSSISGVIATAELKELVTASYDAKRFQILLSIQYYRLVLLINCPVLTAFLNLVIKERKNEREFTFLLEAAAPLFKNDLMAADELQGIIHAITTCAEPFLDRNAAWWTCSYAMFTVNLHLFGILLACKHHETLLPSPSIAEVRTSLDSSLETMRLLERTSLMSRKARCCLVGLLEVFDSLTSDQQFTPEVYNEGDAAATAVPSSYPLDLTAENYVSQYITQSTNDFLFQSSHNEFLNADFGFLYQFNDGPLAQ